MRPKAINKSTHLHASHFSSPTRTLDNRIGIAKLALKSIRDIVTNAFGAVEDAGEIPAVVLDAREVLCGLDVDAVARFIRRTRTVAKQQRTPVLPKIYEDLKTRARALRQAPFAARTPITTIFDHRPRRGTHYGRFNNFRAKCLVRWHIYCDCQVNDSNSRQYQSHLTNANCSTNATILRWDDKILFRDLLFLSHFSLLRN